MLAGPAKVHALAAASLGIMFDAMDASIYFMVLHPSLSELLKTTSDSQIGWYGSLILAVFMLGWALGSIVFGVLADRIGRARTMVVTILLYAVLTGLCATSHSWGELAVYRFLVGLGIGGEISIGAVMLSECWPGKGRIFANCVMESSFCLGYLATSIANLGLGNISWRLLFLVGIIPAFVALYIRLKLKEPDNFRKVSESRRLSQNRRLSQSALLEPLKEIFNQENGSKTILVSTLAGVAIVGYWAALSWVPAWVNQLTGTLAVEERSTVGFVMNISGLIACVASGIMIAKLGRGNTLKLAYLGSLMSTTLMFLLVKDYGSGLLSWIFAVGFFTTIPFVVCVIVIPELFSTHVLGTASGFAFSAGRVVAAIAALTGGQIITMFGGSYAAAGASVGLVYAVGFVAAFFLPETNGEVAGVAERDLTGEIDGRPAPALVAAAVRLRK